MLNANKLYQMRRNARLDRFVRRAHLIIPEWAVVWGARQLGKPLAGHVGGVMLLQACLPRAEQEGWRLFFLGATPQVSQALEERLHRDYPALHIAGRDDLIVDFKTQERAVEAARKINATNATVEFVVHNGGHAYPNDAPAKIGRNTAR